MTKRPNILWISFEDTNPFYGCYGDAVARTPNLDRLAAQGCRWTHCFSTAGVCAPARSAIITGMYSISIGTHHMRTTHTNPNSPELPTPYSAVVPHYVKCFTEYLRGVGYYCTNNEKTDYQFDVPFTAWDEVGPNAHWRNRSHPDQPFFAVFNPMRTHESGMWPDSCPTPEFNPQSMKIPPYFPDTIKVREAMARMYTNIERSDRELAKLLQQLEVDGLAEDTYVLHWSDHGPLPRGKRWPYDSGIHVPLIARGPDIPAGIIADDLVSTVDLGPTMLSLAGVDIPHHIQGRAFLGPQSKPSRDYIYASRDRHDESYDMVRAVRDRRFKYIRNYRPDLSYLPWVPYQNRHPIIQEMWRLHVDGRLNECQSLMFQSPRPTEELYDTQVDPHETCNLARHPSQKVVLTRLRTALDAWLRDVGDMGEISESDMVFQWYPNRKQPQTSAPLFIPITTDNCEMEPTLSGGVYTCPLLIQLHCATQGASIAYTLGSSNTARWFLYTQPLSIDADKSLLRARAVRIGYRDSIETQATFRVETNVR